MLHTLAITWPGPFEMMLLAGLLFGAGLVVSGMSDPLRVLGFLRLGPGWATLGQRRLRPVAEEAQDLGPDLDGMDPEGRTALHLAASSGCPEAVEVLGKLGDGQFHGFETLFNAEEGRLGVVVYAAAKPAG